MTIGEEGKEIYPSWLMWTIEHLTNPFVFIPILVIGFIALAIIISGSRSSSSKCASIGDILLLMWIWK